MINLNDEWEFERECEDALAQDAMTQGEYLTAAVAQYTAVYGAEDRQRAWISTPYDTWERNPYYCGPPVPHPEAD